MDSMIVSRLRRTTTIFGAAFSAVLFLSGCAFSDEALLPSLTGEEPAASQASGSAQPAQTQTVQTQDQPSASDNSPPVLGTTNFQSPGVTSGQPSGTHVGQKIDDLRGDLVRLQTRMGDHNNQL